MSRRKKSKTEAPSEKPKPDPRSILLQELINIAIEISLCEPNDRDELSKLIPQLRKIIKKIRMEFRNARG
ncbi:MAG: hypothetical protein DRJ60_04010 [Thermoprotei archaeon]|nr:MAG: hypothetical protein DRJ60_04010 [Thermoprotei archaeon]